MQSSSIKQVGPKSCSEPSSPCTRECFNLTHKYSTRLEVAEQQLAFYTVKFPFLWLKGFIVQGPDI
jgi:hypothetical protein